jgi:hypothetical protein
MRPRLVCAPIESGYRRVSFPAQEAFFADRRPQSFAFSGVRGGKSEGGADKFADMVWAEACAHLAAVEAGEADRWEPIGSEPMSSTDEPRRLYWVVAPSYRLATITWRKVMRALRPLRHLIVKQIVGEAWLPGGVLIQMRTGKDEAQLQGDRLDGALVDEICVLPESSFDQIQNRLTDHEGWLIGIGSPRPGTWPKSRIWDAGESADVGLHHWTTIDNPHIPRKAIDRAKARLPARWFRRDFQASWDVFDGLVWDEFASEPDEDGRCNVVDFRAEDASQHPCDASVDFGLRRPGVALWARVPGMATDGGDGDVCFAEVVRTDITTEQMAHELANECERWGVTLGRVYCDPAGKARDRQTRTSDLRVMREVLMERGVLSGGVAYPTTQQQRSILHGVQVVASRIRSMDGHRRLFIARRLTEREYLQRLPPGVVGMYGSITGYVWNERVLDEPLKDNVHDHMCDLTRYRAVCLYGQNTITLDEANAGSQAQEWERGEDPSEWATIDTSEGW